LIEEIALVNYSENLLNILSQYDLLNKTIIGENLGTKLIISDVEIQFPDYDKDIWLKNHNVMDFINLYVLFYNYNIFLAEIIKDINEKQKKNIWEIKWGDKNEMTLEDLIKHYIEHLKIHYEHLSKRMEEIKNCMKKNKGIGQKNE
jgi:hypothetical protein